MEQELKTFSLTLDMVRAMRSHPFEVVAGDTGNVLEVRLENDGVPVPLEGRYVCMVFRSGIGTALQDDDSGITLGEEEGTFSIALLPGSYGPGDVSADVQVYSGSDRKTLITSTRFTFRCRNALLNPETMRAQAAYPPLVAATRDAEEAAGGGAGRGRDGGCRHGDDGDGGDGGGGRQQRHGDGGRAELYDPARRARRTGRTGRAGPRRPQGEPGSYETHAHGNVTNAGAIGTAAGRVVCTGEGGVLEAADAEEAAALLGVDGKAPLTHAARHAAGGADAVTPAAIGAAASGHTHTPAAIGAMASAEKGAAGGVATLGTDGKVTAAQAASSVVQVTEAARTLSLSDAGKFLYLRDTGDDNQAYTVTVPPQSEVDFPLGTELELFRYTNGSVTVQAAAGVYLMYAGGAIGAGNSIQIGRRFGVVALKKFSTSLWLVAGDIG